MDYYTCDVSFAPTERSSEYILDILYERSASEQRASGGRASARARASEQARREREREKSGLIDYEHDSQFLRTAVGKLAS
eukprot:6184902-Pleurochrysis_carterae.AAC.1